MIIGIDPGKSTAIARYANGVLLGMQTTDVLGAISFIRLECPKLVVLEDSTLQSYIFTAPGVSHRAALKVARNIGEVDAYCKLIKSVCEELKIHYIPLSPKDKGKKLDSSKFGELTGYSGNSNQHERDAAVIAWRYRNSLKFGGVW